MNMEEIGIEEEIEINEKELQNIFSQYKRIDLVDFVMRLYNRVFDSKISYLQLQEPDPDPSILLKSTNWLMPHYIICLILCCKKHGELKLDSEAEKEIDWRAGLNCFLLTYLTNRKEYDVKIERLSHRLQIELVGKKSYKYQKYYSRIEKRAENIGPVDVLSVLKENHDRFKDVWKKYAKITGFCPQSVFGLLYAMGIEAEKRLTSEIPDEDELSNYLKDNSLKASKKAVEKYFSEVDQGQALKTFEEVILSEELASIYLRSIKSKYKKDPRIWSLPLWDFPVVEADEELFTSVKLLLDSIPELGERIKKKSQNVEHALNEVRHDELINKVATILAGYGYKLYVKIPLPNGEIDLLAEKENEVIQVECKAFGISWKNRFFRLEDEEFDRLYHRFLTDNRIDKERWGKKCEEVTHYVSERADSNYQIDHIVVTSNPAPIPETHNIQEIIWVDELDNWLKERKK